MIDDDELEYEGQEDPETEYNIDCPIIDEKTLAYGMYSQLNTLSNFYSRIQNSYKAVAATWLVASLVGIGYIFSQQVENLPLHPIIACVLISLFSILGVTLLWFLDIYIYQTYFFGTVVAASEIEKKNPWLADINCNILNSQIKDEKHIVLDSYYYIGFNLILLSIMCFAFIALFKVWWSKLVISILFIIIGWLLSQYMISIENPVKSPLKSKFKK